MEPGRSSQSQAMSTGYRLFQVSVPKPAPPAAAGLFLGTGAGSRGGSVSAWPGPFPASSDQAQSNLRGETQRPARPNGLETGE